MSVDPYAQEIEPVRAMPFMAPPGFLGGCRPLQPGEGHWYVLQGDRLLVELGPMTAPSDDPRVRARPAWARLPALGPSTLGFEPVRAIYLGELQGVACWAAEAPAPAPAPAGLGWAALRALFSVLPDTHFALAGRALQLLEWDRTHRYCGRCAAPTEARRDEHARACPACGLVAYPRIAPAVMALVRRGRTLLLARSAHFPPGMYSALAGFVEPGETLEQCVAREVAEEVGVEVCNVRYFASQPWPFPHSLMIAFSCDWAGGGVLPRAGEIETADWFDVLQLPRLPSKISIARRLIEAVAAEIRGAGEPGAARSDARAPSGV